MRRTVLLLLSSIIAAGLLATAGCSGISGGGDSADPLAIRGTITLISPVLAPPDFKGPKPLGVVMVEGKKEADTTYEQANLTVTEATKLLQRDSGGAESSAAFSDLKAGVTVEADVTGTVAGTKPVSATASRVVILK